jgi:PAS domain S-box-containing protein
MLESLGYTLDEIIGKNIVDISAKEFQEKTRIRLQTPSKKSEGRNRTVYLSKGHKRLTMFVRGKVIKRGDQELIFATAREIVREEETGEPLGDEYELWSK